MGLKTKIGANFLFRAPVLCLIYMGLILGNPGLTHSASPGNEPVAAAVGQEMRLAQQGRSEAKPETDASTDSRNIREIMMMQKKLQDQVSAIAQQQEELSQTLWSAERRTYETKMASRRFEKYFIVIMAALGIIICAANIIVLLFFFRRRRQIVKILGITYEAGLILAAVKDRQLEMASLIDDLKEQIEVLGKIGRAHV